MRRVPPPPDPRQYRRYPVRVAAEVGANGRVQVCETVDVSAGGCQVGVLFPLQRGEPVRVRLRAERVSEEPSGAATVVWATREPPYLAGLRFSAPLVEQAGPFLRRLLGPVPLLTLGD
jgi:PilZ domain